MGSSSGSSWGSGVVGGGVGAALWRPLSLRAGVSALVSAGEREHYASLVVVKGSEEKKFTLSPGHVGVAVVSVSVSVSVERRIR